MIAGAVLAAGAGRRFGAAPKQLADVDGAPLLQHAVDAQAAAGLDRRAVVVGAHGDEVLEAVDLRGADTVRCLGWEEGIAASLRAAIAWADGHREALGVAQGHEVPHGPSTWLLITLGDQPRIGAEAVRAVADAARISPADAVRATYDGVAGHPVALRDTLWRALGELRGDEGARELLGDAETVEVGALADPHDVDYPHDLEALTP